MRSGSLLVLVLALGVGATTGGCSPAPDFGGDGATSSGSTSSTAGSTSAGDGSGGSTTASTGSGEGGEAGGESAGGGGEGGAGGGAPGCGEATDCPLPAAPCMQATCSALGVCGTEPRPVGTDGGDCGVCQGGPFAGTCGYRVHTRSFPATLGQDWSAVPLSEVWTGEDAPPPLGITDVEHTRDSGHLFVFRDDATVHERVGDVWQAPVPISTRLPSFPDGARVAASIIWRPTAESTVETLFVTTDELQPRTLSYALEGATITLEAGPTDITPGDDPHAPPQHLVPYDWGFAEQRGYSGSADDWVVFWAGIDGMVYQYQGGDFDWLPAQPDATSPLAMNGEDAAPAPGSAQAAWMEGATVYVLAP